MRRLILWLVAYYVRNHMGHECVKERDAIFRAIGEGVQKEFYEDNFYGRVWFIVHEMTKNMPEALDGYHHMGKTLYHDAVNSAKCAGDAVMEAMQNVPVPEWRNKELDARKPY